MRLRPIAAIAKRTRSAMPMIDATIPAGALSSEAEARLLKELTDILIKQEGFDPANKVAQSVSVVFLHRPAAVFVGGERSAIASCRRCRKGSTPTPLGRRW
jgi:phenylpyruvate tautomerase PptA (4-oxalocrotonate tautomerase family)